MTATFNNITITDHTGKQAYDELLEECKRRAHQLSGVYRTQGNRDAARRPQVPYAEHDED